jgi:hypothetical protein
MTYQILNNEILPNEIMNIIYSYLPLHQAAQLIKNNVQLLKFYNMINYCNKYDFFSEYMFFRYREEIRKMTQHHKKDILIFRPYPKNINDKNKNINISRILYNHLNDETLNYILYKSDPHPVANTINWIIVGFNRLKSGYPHDHSFNYSFSEYMLDDKKIRNKKLHKMYESESDSEDEY